MTRADICEAHAKIRQMVAYIADDKWIASYMRVSVADVAAIRKARRTRTLGRPPQNKPAAATPPLAVIDAFTAAARHGTERLLIAMLAYGARQPAPRRGLPGLSADQFQDLCNQHGVFL